MLIGLGFGSNMPIYLNAVMSAVPQAHIGVASSQVQFWRSLGQTMGVAVLGAVLASHAAVVSASSDTTGAITPEMRPALAEGLQAAFLVGTVAVVIALFAALQLREVPLRGRRTETPTAALETAAETAAVTGD